METVQYAYREVGTGELDGRLLIPHADPMAYEQMIDYLWPTADDARGWLREQVEDESLDAGEVSGWVLVRETVDVVEYGAAALAGWGE